jgi:TonB family protein
MSVVNETMVVKYTNIFFSLSALLIVTSAVSFPTFGQSKQTKRKSQSLYPPIEDQAIKRIEPTYDRHHLRLEGDVIVRVEVDGKGDVTSARAISGHPLLKNLALRAAKNWQFSPRVRNGKPVKNRGTITFHFTPDNRKPNAEDKEKMT